MRFRFSMLEPKELSPELEDGKARPARCELQFSAEVIDDVIMRFEQFLAGCGFTLKVGLGRPTAAEAMEAVEVIPPAPVVDVGLSYESRH